MTQSLDALWEKVRAQKTLIPSLYGDIDFDATPERFTDSMDVRSTLPAHFARKYRKKILADHEKVERARAYTLLGDTVADAYAALMPAYSFRDLIGMLKKACDEGLDAVPDAPQELVDFITAMETTPDWVDMELVREGARLSRNQMANLAPYVIRGAFVATFMNKYSGLPMAITGTLANDSVNRRINETASFFTTATLPGALERFGPGFKAAAMVRLMHSMVRFNILKRVKKWDPAIYGIPIPQVDQMPAGTMPAYLAAFKAMRKGRKHFTRNERAIVELSRYQCFLLGLPEELLPAEAPDIIDTMLAYSGTLREGYDDETCGELTRATMSVYRPKDEKLISKVHNLVERSVSKVFFTQAFLGKNDKSKAKEMGVEPHLIDYALFTVGNLFIMPRLIAYRTLQDIPVANKIADRILVRRINELLVDYGHAEFTTDASQYSPTIKSAT
ncbi:oxygenase MpaB family protein [Alcanivorax jadensis]|uniref:oxygenase MpaB family protein n=1 Tax=Alcanivorax jadensis TaxID=64988 RepID=UPI0026EF1A0E|nr:oxygenase MpaB family protein [Alcanivorax jadensis]